MRAMSRLGKIYIVVGVAALSAVAIACGGNGASNNDQGMSVTFLGLFNSTNLSQAGGGGGGGAGGITPGNQGCGQLPSVFVGGSFRLGEAEPEPNNSTTDSNLSGTNEAGSYVSVVGVQNNLYGQVFRADRVYIDYYIPGASAQPPSTSVPVSLLAGPAESATSTQGVGAGAGAGAGGSGVRDPGIRRPAYTSLPPALSNICNRALAQVTIVPAAVREWLNFNRDLTPEAPYKMEVTIRVSGLTSSGDRVDTNDGTFDFEILPETLVVPTDGLATPEATAAASTQVEQLSVDADSEHMSNQAEDFVPPADNFETQSSYEGQE
jgi:hypothetical protein